MYKIFFDTEFTDLSDNAKLISIGLVDITGKYQFYAELSDTYSLSDCSEFVHGYVLPYLEGGDKRLTLNQLSVKLKEWIEAFDKNVSLVCDSDWDTRFLHLIFPDKGQSPANLKTCEILWSEDFAFPKCFQNTVEAAFSHDLLRRNHALDDAIANRRGWIAIQS